MCYLTDVLENIILNAQYRIFRDVPIDADRKQQSGNLVPGQETINCSSWMQYLLEVYKFMIQAPCLQDQTHG